MPGLLSGLHVALRSLLSQRLAIQVTEHNVASAAVEGYRRQEAVFAPGPPYAPPETRGGMAGQIGTGVEVARIRRYSLALLDGRVREARAQAGRWEVREEALTQLEAVLAETEGEGLNARLDAFWSAWQRLSARPQDLTLRAEVRQRAEDLAAAFQGRALRLIAARRDQDQALAQDVQTFNDLAARVASLNAEIARVLGAGDSPNDLMDERDRLLDRLVDLSGATVSFQENGEVLVSVNGHALVVGSKALQVVATPDPGNGNLLALTWEDGRAFTPQAGQMAGRLELRDSLIPTFQSGLDGLAAALISRVNALHQSGYGLNNATGLDFFEGSDALTIRVSGNLDDLQNLAAAKSPDAPGDGSLAMDLAAVRDELLMAGGTATLNGFAAAEAARLGILVNEARSRAAEHGLVAESLAQQRQAVTGVSLDEEAANLVRYQRVFEASARLMTVLDELLDKVINGMGVVGR